MKKRLLAALLTLVLALALAVPAFAEEVTYNSITFSDVVSYEYSGAMTTDWFQWPLVTVKVGTTLTIETDGRVPYLSEVVEKNGMYDWVYPNGKEFKFTQVNGRPGVYTLTLTNERMGPWCVQGIDYDGYYVFVKVIANSGSTPTTPTEPEKPTTPAEPEKPATAAELGLKVTGWAKADVDKALAAGLYDEALGKDMTVGITRAQAAAVAVKLYEAMDGAAMPMKDNPFTDTNDPNVVKAYSLGLIDGNGSGLFAPDAPLNREAVAVMLAKVYRKLGGTIPAAGAMKFADSAKISSWARAEVSFMEAKGIVKGNGTNFNPQGPITGQEALILGLNMMSTLK